MMIDAEDLVIHKEIHVNVPLEQAFDGLHERASSDWWPTETHSIGKGAVSADWRVGGLVVETAGEQRFEWVDVLEYDPPLAVPAALACQPRKAARQS